ncbi:NADP-dependent succinic semialdehyde dehydrogenase [Nocardioides donggukensis]|uniref:NADP-dependent succinic semialdehyde dehydrogenase n=1 Tax=Nocardioides donggukensis TaxID=2774019 RepID=A0A927K708_9ACTN|nr:NADP-dependent succinic semialdehyde dehydrogenase [Nocardioides donggukensis]MBD8871101.1 NADP-dependent succinic semialdehyde dehydrogenase [Nocardioides donggukensis]
MPIATTDPRTGEVLRTFEELTPEEVEAAIGRASAAAADYRLTSYDDRAAWLRRAAELLDERTDELAELVTLEMGKTRASAAGEIGKCASALRYYADHGAEHLADEPIDAETVGASRAYGRYLPIGVVLAVMPWNFPWWQAMRFAAPALMAGNVGLLKHASNVPQTALAIEQLFVDAGFPDHVFTTLLVGSSAVESVITDSRVAAATLTGSEGAGVAVGRVAGESLKKVVLELGGSDPFVVMPSADLEEAARVATTSRTQNCGQSCIAAKRFIVHADVYDEWLGLFLKAMSGLTVGDPMEEGTDVGPLATEQGREDVVALVDAAVADGATLELGGETPDRPGWWYPPTVLTGVTEDMELFHEEAFGPVATVFKVGSIEEAVTLANATRFGLGANAWTTDAAEQEIFVRDLEAGQTFINSMTASHPAMPFGGVKASGHGRELSAAGIREFTNLKTVWIA